jgi:type III pantothenate kinase
MTIGNHVCIDIGNTNIHVGIFNGLKLIESSHFSTSEFSPGCSFFKYIPRKLPVSYCSVVPAAESILLKELPAGTSFFRLNFSNCGIPISYPNPKEIGPDRLANSISAYEMSPDFSIIVDVGTATTFDIVSKDDGYKGGVIAPGPQGYLDFLHQNTALLPSISLPGNLTTQNKIGKSTKEAMILGVQVGYHSMVTGIIDSIIDELPQGAPPPTLFLVGGASTLLKSLSFEIRPNFTLEGLAIASRKFTLDCFNE